MLDWVIIYSFELLDDDLVKYFLTQKESIMECFFTSLLDGSDEIISKIAVEGIAKCVLLGKIVDNDVIISSFRY
jgi:hypothetical protein